MPFGQSQGFHDSGRPEGPPPALAKPRRLTLSWWRWKVKTRETGCAIIGLFLSPPPAFFS